MSEIEKFDDFIKGGFGDYVSEVPEGMWNRIMEERRKRRPKGFIFFRGKTILLGTIILAGLSVSYFMFSKAGRPGKPEKNLIVSHNKGNAVIAKLPSPETKDRPDIIAAPEISVRERLLPAAKTKKEMLGHKGLTVTIVSFDDNVSKGLPMETIVKTRINDRVKETDITSGETDVLAAEDAIVITAESNNEMMRSKAEKLTLVPVGRDAFSMRGNNTPHVYLPDCPQVEKDAAINKRYFEVYFGPDYIFRTFTDTPHSAYLQKRRESTKIASAFSAGFRYSQVFKNGISVKTGINFSQINEKFTYVQDNLVQVTYIIDPQTGDTTGSYTITGSRKKVTNNRYRSLDIPLLLGYEFGNGKLHVNINAGAMVNIYSWQRGDVLDSTYKPVNITTGKSASDYQFRSNIGVALSGGVAFYYKLNDYLHVMAEPYFRYNLRPMSKETLTLKQKYNALGMHVGLRLDIP